MEREEEGKERERPRGGGGRRQWMEEKVEHVFLVHGGINKEEENGE